MTLEILGLLKNFLEHFVMNLRRITGCGKQNDDVHFQFSFYVIAIIPVGYSRLLLHKFLDFLFTDWSFSDKRYLITNLVIYSEITAINQSEISCTKREIKFCEHSGSLFLTTEIKTLKKLKI